LSASARLQSKRNLQFVPAFDELRRCDPAISVVGTHLKAPVMSVFPPLSVVNQTSERRRVTSQFDATETSATSAMPTISGMRPKMSGARRRSADYTTVLVS
jgi:hypothetical protein